VRVKSRPSPCGRCSCCAVFSHLPAFWCSQTSGAQPFGCLLLQRAPPYTSPLTSVPCERIRARFDQLGAVDVTGVEPALRATSNTNNFREDVPSDFADKCALSPRTLETSEQSSPSVFIHDFYSAYDAGRIEACACFYSPNATCVHFATIEPNRPTNPQSWRRRPNRPSALVFTPR